MLNGRSQLQQSTLAARRGGRARGHAPGFSRRRRSCLCSSLAAGVARLLARPGLPVLCGHGADEGLGRPVRRRRSPRARRGCPRAPKRSPVGGSRRHPFTPSLAHLHQVHHFSTSDFKLSRSFDPSWRTSRRGIVKLPRPVRWLLVVTNDAPEGFTIPPPIRRPVRVHSVDDPTRARSVCLLGYP